mmetsp:Transcript_6087/g.12024  ORF Transcript_6087/g.12024 Transcript_6087/m.12024 type:complete len:356 (+) Transcript_6087:380-1447(+)
MPRKRHQHLAPLLRSSAVLLRDALVVAHHGAHKAAVVVNGKPAPASPLARRMVVVRAPHAVGNEVESNVIEQVFCHGHLAGMRFPVLLRDEVNVGVEEREGGGEMHFTAVGANACALRVPSHHIIPPRTLAPYPLGELRDVDVGNEVMERWHDHSKPQKGVETPRHHLPHVMLTVVVALVSGNRLDRHHRWHRHRLDPSRREPQRRIHRHSRATPHGIWERPLGCDVCRRVERRGHGVKHPVQLQPGLHVSRVQQPQRHTHKVLQAQILRNQGHNLASRLGPGEEQARYHRHRVRIKRQEHGVGHTHNNRCETRRRHHCRGNDEIDAVGIHRSTVDCELDRVLLTGVQGLQVEPQ